MSGGSFDYAYSKVLNFADRLQEEIERNNIPDPVYNCCQNFSSNTVGFLKDIEVITRIVASLMKETEWLYSSDTGEDTFVREVVKLLDDLEANV